MDPLVRTLILLASVLLFGYQYSHVWIDPRGLQDAYMREKGIDYFENARRATLANRAYCIDNPRGFEGYGEDVWGLTACQGPARADRIVAGDTIRFRGYSARGASLRYVYDDGTLSPSAAGGSVPFAPEVSIPALRRLVGLYGEHLYGPYGFADTFNLTFRAEDGDVQRGRIVPGIGWFDSDALGTNQAPILLMIENYRSQVVWDTMRDNAYIVQGLCRAGFTSDWLDGRCEE